MRWHWKTSSTWSSWHANTSAITVFLNHHVGILKWSQKPLRMFRLTFQTIYNWLNAGRLDYHWLIYLTKASVKNVNLMVNDKYLCMVVRLKRYLKVWKHDKRFGHFEVDTMQSGKGALAMCWWQLLKRLSRQHIVRQVTGRNSQAVTPVLIRFFQRDQKCQVNLLWMMGREFAKI